MPGLVGSVADDRVDGRAPARRAGRGLLGDRRAQLIAGQQPALADDTPVLLKDINPGSGASSLDGFAQLGGFTYFVSTDPATPGLV